MTLHAAMVDANASLLLKATLSLSMSVMGLPRIDVHPPSERELEKLPSHIHYE